MRLPDGPTTSRSPSTATAPPSATAGTSAPATRTRWRSAGGPAGSPRWSATGCRPRGRRSSPPGRPPTPPSTSCWARPGLDRSGGVSGAAHAQRGRRRRCGGRSAGAARHCVAAVLHAGERRPRGVVRRAHGRLGRRQPGLLARGAGGRRARAAAHRRPHRRGRRRGRRAGSGCRRRPARRDHPLARRRRASAEPDVVTFTPAGPGALLLCSDGLWKYLARSRRARRRRLPALALGGPQAAVAALVAAALAAGGADNITVAVLPVHPPQEAQ